MRLLCNRLQSGYMWAQRIGVDSVILILAEHRDIECFDIAHGMIG